MKKNLKSKIFIGLSIFIINLPLFAAEIITNEKSAAAKITPFESLLPMLFGLSGVLLVIVILALLIKKVTGLNIISNNIKVIESQSLGAKEKLVIVEIQQQQYVLGVTAHSINQICRLQKNIEKKPGFMPFDKIMTQFMLPKKTQAQKTAVLDMTSSSEKK